MKKRYCHSFLHFGQIVPFLSVVPLKFIEMSAEETSHFVGPSSLLRRAKWSSLYLLSNGSTILYWRHPLNISYMGIELFQHSREGKVKC